MGSLIAKFAFLPPPSTYDGTLANQYFVDSEIGKISCISFPKVLRLGRLTVMYCHGNAEDIGLCRSFLSSIHRSTGVNAVAFDYPGYGMSPPVVGEERAVLAAQAVWDDLVLNKKIHPSVIALYGRSLGSGVAIELACRVSKGDEKPSSHHFCRCEESAESVDDTAIESKCASESGTRRMKARGCCPAGMVLHSPIASCLRVVFSAVSLRPLDMFDNINKIHLLDFPIFIIHGKSDTVVPFAHGVALHERCRKPAKPMWVERADHNDIEEVAGGELQVRLRDFFNDLMKSRKE